MQSHGLPLLGRPFPYPLHCPQPHDVMTNMGIQVGLPIFLEIHERAEDRLFELSSQRRDITICHFVFTRQKTSMAYLSLNEKLIERLITPLFGKHCKETMQVHQC